MYKGGQLGVIEHCPKSRKKGSEGKSPEGLGILFFWKFLTVSIKVQN